MPIQIALLRGVNVGGRNMVAMASLRTLMNDLGFTGASTLLQSGNVVFQSSEHASAALERRLEDETTKRLGVSVDYVVRSSADWTGIVAANPFPRAALEDPARLVLMCLKSAPAADRVDALRAAARGPESLHFDTRQLYIVYPTGIGRSKLTGGLIEGKLGVRGTARNWKTVLKLAALCV